MMSERYSGPLFSPSGRRLAVAGLATWLVVIGVELVLVFSGTANDHGDLTLGVLGTLFAAAVFASVVMSMHNSGRPIAIGILVGVLASVATQVVLLGLLAAGMPDS